MVSNLNGIKASSKARTQLVGEHVSINVSMGTYTPISRSAILDRVPHQNEAGRACGHLEGCVTWSLSGNNAQIWLTIIAV